MTVLFAISLVVLAMVVLSIRRGLRDVRLLEDWQRERERAQAGMERPR